MRSQWSQLEVGEDARVNLDGEYNGELTAIVAGDTSTYTASSPKAQARHRPNTYMYMCCRFFFNHF